MSKSADGQPHIALVITALHLVPGGAERVLVDVANGLHQRGHRVSILTYQDQNGPSFYPLDYGIARYDARRRHARGGTSPFRALAGPARRRRSVAIATWIAQYGPKVYRLRRLLRIVRPDIVISFLPSSFTYVELACTGTGVRTVASIHNVPTRELGGDANRWDQNPVDIALRRRALRTSDANTVLLPSFVNQLDAEVRSKTYVIPNLIHRYEGPLARVAGDDEGNTILAVGRLSPAKDQATLVRAWSLLERDHPTWRLRIIGEGPLRYQLDQLIRDLGVERVSIDEPTSDIESAYTSAKFLVMPSVHEGFGLVTAEAMDCGLPVIGFADCEGTNEIVIDGQNGLLVEPGDDRAAALAESMRTLIADEALRARLAGGAPASVEAFRPAPVIDLWEALIRDVWRGEVPS